MLLVTSKAENMWADQYIRLTKVSYFYALRFPIKRRTIVADSLFTLVIQIDISEAQRSEPEDNR